MKNLPTISAVLLIVLAAAPAFANVKVRTERTSAGQTYEDTVYIKEKRRRTETMNGALVNITQCDAGREISMNPALKTYTVSEFGNSGQTGTATVAATGSGSPATRGGTVTTTSTVKDTGERKQFFGYTARRIKTVIVIESSADACAVNNSKMETDGWYIDETFGFDCGASAGEYRPVPAVNGGGCRDNYVTKTNGTAKKGFAVFEKTLIFNEGREPFEMTTEVREISKEPLDDALFEVPDDYRQVTDSSELYAASPAMTGNSGRIPVPSPASSLPVPNIDSPEPVGSTIGEKKPGTVRIGIANIKVAASGENMSAQDLAVAFRNTLAEYLKTPDIEVVYLESRLPQAVQAEAAKLECDAVIYGTVSHKKGGGGGFGGMFGKVIAPAVGATGIGHTGSVAGNIAGQVATVAIVNAGNVAANTKAKDEIMFDLDLTRIGAAGLKKQYKRKAKSAGEDLITSIVEQAATEIVEALSR
ncbi:MAG: hypothetical protein IPM63_10610 [Acidobacteriota bacterium]|nr:MAG: hypothetical protein IPM63_10610 [Acidobacteriota bacterium]